MFAPFLIYRLLRQIYKPRAEQTVPRLNLFKITEI